MKETGRAHTLEGFFGSVAVHGALVGIMIGGAQASLLEPAQKHEFIELDFLELPSASPDGASRTAPESPAVERPLNPSKPRAKRRRVTRQAPRSVATPKSYEAPDGPKPRRMAGLGLGSTATGGGFELAVADTGTEGGAPSRSKNGTGGEGGNRRARGVPDGRHAWTKPKRIAPIEPEYPPEARARGIEADVTLEITIDGSGRIIGVRVVGASPFPSINRSARRAAHREQFSPALRDGVPVPYTLTFSYRFRLEG